MLISVPARRLLAVLALALVVGVLVVVRVGDRATGGTHPSRCARDRAQADARYRAGAPASSAATVVLGDSYAVGLHLPRLADSWPSRLSGPVSVLGFSGSGYAADASPCGPHVAFPERLPAALADGARLVVLEGGLNDHDRPRAAVVAGFRRTVGRLAGHDVLVVGPAAAPRRLAGARRVDRLLRAESARAGVRYLSMLDLDLPYLPDRLHLTREGHRLFGDAVARTLRRTGALGGEAERPRA